MAQEVTPSLSLTVVQKMPWTMLYVAGDLAWETHRRFDDCLSEIVNSAHEPRICLDLSRLEFCDSSGIATMLRASLKAEGKGGMLILLRPNRNFVQRLALLGLNGTFRIVDQLPK